MKLLNIHNYLLRHVQVMLSSLGELWRQPVATSMTLLVIGIALLLPAGLFVILKNVEQVSGEWQHANRISLFLQDEMVEYPCDPARFGRGAARDWHFLDH